MGPCLSHLAAPFTLASRQLAGAVGNFDILEGHYGRNGAFFLGLVCSLGVQMGAIGQTWPEGQSG
jgi:hypothetical protein